MVELKDAIDAVGKEALFDCMVYIFADNVSGKKLKKWDLKNIHKWRLIIKC
jgi:hypothetical protein